VNNNVLESLVKEKDYFFKKQLFKVVKDFKLTINELILLIYFLNQDNPVLDTNIIKEITSLDEKEILEAFTFLNSKGLLTINMIKSKDGKVNEVIDLGNVYKAFVSNINANIKSKTKQDIFTIFEQEFGRTLSPMEFEVITQWVKSGMNEELIIGALKEATYNGVSNLRYIDKIIYEWGKKGFKSMDDVNNHLQRKTENTSPNKENNILFDYNWLEDEE
jgi:DNA replication protein